MAKKTWSPGDDIECPACEMLIVVDNEDKGDWAKAWKPCPWCKAKLIFERDELGTTARIDEGEEPCKLSSSK